MVSFQDIRTSNARIHDSAALQVAVFVGGTSGIGKLTIAALVATGISVRIYLVGRKSSESRSAAWIREIKHVNPNAEILWVEGEVSLLVEVVRICNQIKQKESFVDLLFLTAGYAPMGPREFTTEGLEIAQSLEYYSRVLFALELLPILKKSPHARVISVLGGGLERTSSINLDDLELKNPRNFGFAKAQGHYLTMGTVALDKLAEDNTEVTFVHSWPSIVNTGNIDRGGYPGFVMSWLIWAVIKPVIYLISYSDEEAGQRHLFQATSAAFGGQGTPWKGQPGIHTGNAREKSGLFLVNYKCECTPNRKVISELQEKARARVWDHTMQKLGPYLQG